MLGMLVAGGLGVLLMAWFAWVAVVARRDARALEKGTAPY